MAPGTITLRINEDRRSELEALARGRGETVSDLIRAAIDDVVLGREADRSPIRTGPPSLTLVERSVLAAQHRLMAATKGVDDYEIEDHVKMAEILENGFSGEYDTVFLNLEPELSRTECRLLWDILDMFSVLESNFNRLDDEQKAKVGRHAEHALSFRGFDFNDALEARLGRYTKFLFRQDRWAEQVKVLEHDGGNSHSPMLETYKRMLLAFSPIWSLRTSDHSRGRDRLFLDLEELKAVYGAWPHPRS
jgi:uncharacterized protein YfbU (UPF0304 family)